MNDIYKKAINEQGTQGAPIFCANLKIYKVIKHGNSTKTKREYYTVKEKVVSGTEMEIKYDKVLLKQIITKLFDYKTACEEMTKGRFFIDEIEILQFLSYSFNK